MTKTICHSLERKYKDWDIYISMYIHIGGIMYIMITWAPEGLILLASSLS